MPTLRLMLDRRTEIRGEVRTEVESLVETIRGLDVEWETEDTYEGAPDAARFRDFVPFARLSHDDEEALEWVTEELIERFGWQVDLAPLDDEET